MRTMQLNIAGAPVQIRGGWLTVGALILSLILMPASIWLGGWCFSLGLILFLIVCITNSLVIVGAENTAYKETLGKVSHKVLMSGPRFVFPFITKVVMVNTKKNGYAHQETNIDPSDGFKLDVSYTIFARLEPTQVWRFAREYNLPIDTNYLVDYMQKILRDEYVRYSCDELRTNAASRAIVQDEVHTKFMDMVTDKLDMSLFSELDVIIKDYIYSPEYLALVERVKKAEKEAEAAKAEKEAQIIEAEGVAKSTEIIADADAKAIEKKGSAENKVLKRKGEILTEKPAISENEVAKHYPQYVGGGIMPTLSVKEMLNGGSTTSSTPTPPTP
jgi:regulator of protease activity HflC (stomatin/prohibitin superfamily)